MFGQLNNKAYIVGGAVRDELMGMAPEDVDYAVEATEELFRKAFPDLPQVGQSFPVFLLNGCEVALTRTEKSTGECYKDFSCSAGVAIEEDLSRRDFTINSIAKNYLTGELLDPYGGIRDVELKLVRCINQRAFIEDPLRILRAIRFAVRFGFRIDDETRSLIRKDIGRLKYVTKERVAAELEKVYAQADRPSDFFRLLDDLGGLRPLYAPLAALKEVPAGPQTTRHGKATAFEHTMDAIDRAKKNGCRFGVFLAVLCHDYGKAGTPAEILPNHYGHELRSVKIAAEWLGENRFRNKDGDLVITFARNHMKVHVLEKMKPAKLVRFFRSIPKKYREDFIAASDCDCPLNERKIQIFKNLLETMDLKIDSRRLQEIKDPRSVPSEVQRQYVEFYNELSKAR